MKRSAPLLTIYRANEDAWLTSEGSDIVNLHVYSPVLAEMPSTTDVHGPLAGIHCQCSV